MRCYLGVGTRAATEDLVTVLCGRPEHQLPAGGRAGVGGWVSPGRRDHKAVSSPPEAQHWTPSSIWGSKGNNEALKYSPWND